MVENVSSGLGYVPQRQRIKRLKYAPNPGTQMDKNFQYVTAVDGEPKQGIDSPGNFYLFNATTGSGIWEFPTKKNELGLRHQCQWYRCFRRQ